MHGKVAVSGTGRAASVYQLMFSASDAPIRRTDAGSRFVEAGVRRAALVWLLRVTARHASPAQTLLKLRTNSAQTCAHTLSLPCKGERECVQCVHGQSHTLTRPKRGARLP